MGLFKSLNETDFESALRTMKYKPNGIGWYLLVGGEEAQALQFQSCRQAGGGAGTVRAAPISLLSYPQVRIAWQEERVSRGLKTFLQEALPCLASPILQGY